MYFFCNVATLISRMHHQRKHLIILYFSCFIFFKLSEKKGDQNIPNDCYKIRENKPTICTPPLPLQAIKKPQLINEIEFNLSIKST